MRHADALDRLVAASGVFALAQRLETSEATVRRWRQDGIPPAAWREVQSMTRRAGRDVSIDTLRSANTVVLWDALVGVLGTEVALAQLLQVRPSTITHWRKRARGIPPHQWTRVVAVARRVGVALTLDDLAAGQTDTSSGGGAAGEVSEVSEVSADPVCAA